MQNPDDLVITRTAPSEVEGIVIRFDPGRGQVVDHFPKLTFMADEALATYRSHPGVITLNGRGGVGTRVQFTCANGEAVYELVYRARLPNNVLGYAAERRLAVPRVCGGEEEVRTFDQLQGFTDLWPMYAGFSAQFLRHPGVTRNGRLVTIHADGVEADYLLTMRHPVRKDSLLAERTRLRTPTGTTVTLPTASMRSLPVSH